MRTNEFCYWLQGFFELNMHVDSLSEMQLKLIRGHLRLVTETEKQLSGFPLWLDGFLKGLDCGNGSMIALNKKPTNEIEEELAKFFKNVIDNSYSVPADQLRQAHPDRPTPDFMKDLKSGLGDAKFNC